ncbi:hypothetical protein ACF05W_27660 [Streptomyces lydicus]|uniref:hypothetical protein n=1 Tax=Streptomyces lydicus TaxID=47763 RepID=UPI0036FC5B34
MAKILPALGAAAVAEMRILRTTINARLEGNTKDKLALVLPFRFNPARAFGAGAQQKGV